MSRWGVAWAAGGSRAAEAYRGAAARLSACQCWRAGGLQVGTGSGSKFGVYMDGVMTDGGCQGGSIRRTAQIDTGSVQGLAEQPCQLQPAERCVPLRGTQRCRPLAFRAFPTLPDALAPCHAPCHGTAHAIQQGTWTSTERWQDLLFIPTSMPARAAMRCPPAALRHLDPTRWPARPGGTSQRAQRAGPAGSLAPGLCRQDDALRRCCLRACRRSEPAVLLGKGLHELKIAQPARS